MNKQLRRQRIEIGVFLAVLAALFTIVAWKNNVIATIILGWALVSLAVGFGWMALCGIVRWWDARRR